MKGVNKVIIVGTLGKDPEVLNGITKFSVATSETWLDKKTMNKKEKTEWHNCSAFGQLAEICAKYLKKGSKVYIEGKIETNKSEKDGVTRYFTGINVREMQMLDSKPTGEQAQNTAAGSGVGTAIQMQAGNFDNFDDDIPF